MGTETQQALQTNRQSHRALLNYIIPQRRRTLQQIIGKLPSISSVLLN